MFKHILYKHLSKIAWTYGKVRFGGARVSTGRLYAWVFSRSDSPATSRLRCAAPSRRAHRCRCAKRICCKWTHTALTGDWRASLVAVAA